MQPDRTPNITISSYKIQTGATVHNTHPQAPQPQTTLYSYSSHFQSGQLAVRYGCTRHADSRIPHVCS